MRMKPRLSLPIWLRRTWKASHGVMLVPMYVERLIDGSVSKRRLGEVVSDKTGAVVIDAG
jgi:LDH2 family malate/lactate/ureidoglycolate dehydrogenase